jgi:hypothetical protein
MSKEWIDNLADSLKEKGREGAESYATEQHRAGIVDAEGKVFFTALVLELEQNFADVRSRLQGSAVSCETSVMKESPTRLTLKRSRFPWFDATLKHEASVLMLEYVQGRGVPGEQTLGAGVDRKAVSFSFGVDTRDKLSVAETFGEASRQFDEPADLARYIVELLFKV